MAPATSRSSSLASGSAAMLRTIFTVPRQEASEAESPPGAPAAAAAAAAAVRAAADSCGCRGVELLASSIDTSAGCAGEPQREQEQGPERRRSVPSTPQAAQRPGRSAETESSMLLPAPEGEEGNEAARRAEEEKPPPPPQPPRWARGVRCLACCCCCVRAGV